MRKFHDSGVNVNFCNPELYDYMRNKRQLCMLKTVLIILPIYTFKKMFYSFSK